MTITEAFALYEQQELYRRDEKTKRNHRSAISSMIYAIGDLPVQIISSQTVSVWDTYMINAGNTGTTRAGYMSSLRQLLRFLRGLGLQVMHPADIERPRRDTPPKAWLTPAEAQLMLQTAEKPLHKALVVALWETGGRVSEVLALNRSDLEEEHITVQSKGGKYIDLSLAPYAKNIIQAYLDTRRDRYPPIFLSAQNRRMSVQRAEQIIHHVALEAGIEEYKNVTPHTFRHGYVTDQITNGAPVKEVSEQVGHAKVSTTLNTYHHILPTAKWEAKAKYHTPIS